MSTRRQVVVIGGGISGLAAAWELTGGVTGPGPATPEVTIFETSDQLGGALRSAAFGGRTVDVGPDSFLGRRPEALELSREVGLEDSLVPIAGRGAAVWARGRLRALPDGLALGVPTRFWPTARSGVLGPRGVSGLARDVLLPRPGGRGPIGDRSIGPLVGHKLGHRVVDALVDPLIGGIHAGSVDDMSAAATFPPLLAAAQRRGSLMRALRAEIPTPDPDAPPLFWALSGGMASLVEHLGQRLRQRGVVVCASTPVERLERGAARWRVMFPGGATEADAIIVTVSAPVAADLLRPHDDEAARLLDAIDYSSVALVTFSVPEDAVTAPLYGTGFLVPRRSPVPPGRDPLAMTACTYLSAKWPHLARSGEILLRASSGRSGDDRPSAWSDDDIIERIWEELGLVLGVTGRPLASMVSRFPDAFPQYRVHHLMRSAGIEAAVARLGGVAVGGAAYRGVGIPACIASGRAAARAVL
jgi:oxygen-dependent protoporphyrinogen oxidase